MPILAPETSIWIDETRRKWNVPAVSVAVVTEQGQETYAYGSRDGVEPTNTKSSFLIASCSKIFVATAIGLLISDGAKLASGESLSWTTKLGDILDWELQDEIATKHADIIDLLSMRIGLPGHDRMLGAQSPAEVVHQLRRLRLSAEFRQVRQYSNIGYTVGTEIIRVVSGQDYEDFVQQRILRPLGMVSSTFDYASTQDIVRSSGQHVDQKRASESWRKDGAETVGETQFYDWPGAFNPTILAGAGGIWSNAQDMCFWLREQMKPELIPQTIRETIYTPHFYAYGPSEATGHYLYGLGTYVFTYRGHVAYHHAGGCPGQYSYQVVLPGKAAVFVHSNDDNHSPYLNRAFTCTILDSLLQSGARDWTEEVMTGRYGAAVPDSAEAKHETSPDVSGTYEHGVYPSLEVRRLRETDDVHRDLSLIRQSSNLSITGDIFISASKSIFVDHLVFVHDRGSLFTWIAVKQYKSTPRPYYAVDGTGECWFGRDGLGMGGDWWESGKKRSTEVRPGMKPEEFEVWYAKCNP